MGKEDPAMGNYWIVFQKSSNKSSCTVNIAAVSFGIDVGALLNNKPC